ncbi:MAG: RIP metalloprotease RseP, partial [Thermoanaerobaculales bacterium]|nr:RIP metalloprotease RseP [Thermoanaerobaculales bacterium]
MLTLAAFVFVIGVLITIHEAGHFAMARLLGAPVEVFSIGFGKRLWGFERGGTDYRISLVPLGGYVRIIGLGPDESDIVGDGADDIELLPRWKRTLILLAGPLTNIVAAVGFVALAFVIGVEVQAYLDDPPVVGWVEPGSGADLAGIREGDLVRAVQGEPSDHWRDLEIALLTAGGGEVLLEVERDGFVSDVSVTLGVDYLYGFGVSGIKPFLDSVIQPRAGGPAAGAGILTGDRIVAVNGNPVTQYYELPLLIEPHPGIEIRLDVIRDHDRLSFDLTTMNEAGAGKIGVVPLFPTVVETLGILPAIRTGFIECQRMTIQTFQVIGRLLTRKASIRQVSGPVGIAQISGEAARSGIEALIMLMGIISLQLGIFNLLPIPILDGGHLTVIAVESIIGRDLPLKVKERILEVGFYLLILLMVVVLFNDIVRFLPDSVRQFIFRG